MRRQQRPRDTQAGRCLIGIWVDHDVFLAWHKVIPDGKTRASILRSAISQLIAQAKREAQAQGEEGQE